MEGGDGMESLTMGTHAPVRTAMVVPRRAEPPRNVAPIKPPVPDTDRPPCPARRVELPAPGSVGVAFG